MTAEAASITIVPAAPSEDRPEHRDPREHHDPGGDRRRDRADEDVVVADVGELVREDTGQLLLIQDLQDAFRHRDGSMLLVPTGGERVGLRRRHHVQPRHRHPRLLRELADDPVEPRRFLLGYRTRPGDLQDDLVAPPVAREVDRDGDEKEEEHPVGAAPEVPLPEHIADEEQKRGQNPHEEKGLHRVSSGNHRVDPPERGASTSRIRC